MCSGMTTLIILKELGRYDEKIKSLENSDLVIKVISETIKNEAKVQKGGFFSMLLGTFSTMLVGKVVILAGDEVTLAGEETIRAGQDF